MRLSGLVLSIVLLPLLAVQADAAQLTGSPHVIDKAEECDSLYTSAPERHELPVAGDYETPLALRVHVLMVGTPRSVAARVMRHVDDLYSSISIDVRPRFETVDLEISVPPTDPLAPPTSESTEYIAASKEHLGGKRPAQADVVYTMIGGEIAGTVAGQADCVGGIAYDDAAFAVGEANWENAYYVRESAVIAAHEISHLLAAHHHFANCVEGNDDIAEDRFHPCTLMFNQVPPISLRFSTLEAAVVRRWALEYLGKA
jgi:hypothetical protein